MHGRNNETFKNPILPVRPLTVDPTRRFERHSDPKIKLKEQRPRTSAVHFGKKSLEDFQSSSTSTTFSFASEDEYDTDIDDDFNQYREHSCLGFYKRVCQYQQAVPVGEYLRHYNQKDFSLHYYGIGPKGMRSFIPSLTMNQFITKLDLASNGLGDEGLIYLSHILRDNTAIVDLNLAQNFIGIDGIRALCDMLKDNITINHLRLDGNLLNDECARLFAELITNTGQLHTLRLANNKLGPTSGHYLGDGLVENTTMQLMDLSGNALAGRGSVALVKGIQKNVFLKTLNLARNGLSGADFARAWVNAVKENNTLIELDLSENRLNTECATYIGRAIANSESLEVVRLSGNPLESSGCYAIVKALIAKNVAPNRLRRIELVDRRIKLNDDFKELYKEVQAQRPEIEIIYEPAEILPPKPVKRENRQLRPAMERLHTLFQRRPHLDLAQFFLDIADEADEMLDRRITDSEKLKLAIREHLGANFFDDDVEKILKHISHYDSKKFAQVFDNKPTNIHTTTTWRLRN